MPGPRRHGTMRTVSPSDSVGPGDCVLNLVNLPALSRNRSFDFSSFFVETRPRAASPALTLAMADPNEPSELPTSAADLGTTAAPVEEIGVVRRPESPLLRLFNSLSLIYRRRIRTSTKTMTKIPLLVTGICFLLQPHTQRWKGADSHRTVAAPQLR